MIVQVRDLEGNVIRTIPPSDALDIMSGAAALAMAGLALSGLASGVDTSTIVEPADGARAPGHDQHR